MQATEGFPASEVRRGPAGVPLAGALLAGVCALCGCIVPPVIAPSGDPGWTLDSGRSSYPEDASIVEVPGAAESEPTLRGLYVPADEGAPLVVHFAESGGSIPQSLHTRGQYRQLAELGFASLAVDYRGVGLSDGERSPTCLDQDA